MKLIKKIAIGGDHAGFEYKAELIKLVPNVNWDIYFGSIGIKSPEHIILNQPKFYEGLNLLINSITIAEWKVFLKWNLMALRVILFPFLFLLSFSLSLPFYVYHKI